MKWGLLLPGLSLSAASEIPSQLDPLLDEIERRASRYFYEQADGRTGLVRDRARSDGRDERRVSSIAATGFGLSALSIADTRGYLNRGSVRRRVKRTLEFLAHRAPHEHGFFYHFVDMRTGARAWGSELSSVDTAWLLCGVLHCRAHFQDNEIVKLATDILDRVDWRWMLAGGDTLSHGWTPEGGFLPYRWDSYSELMAMYLLAIGSRTHPIPASSWDAWKRPTRNFGRLTYIDSSTPLFTHQYSHAWIDFRERRDRYTDYFENSRRATLAHRQHCLQLARNYPWYTDDVWGFTAADSRKGYLASPPAGILVPCAAGGSIAFLPRECGTVLHRMLEHYGHKAWCRYGFVDSFQPSEDWYNPDVIGIDLGIMLLMAENARSEAVWRTCRWDPEIHRGGIAVALRNV